MSLSVGAADPASSIWALLCEQHQDPTGWCWSHGIISAWKNKPMAQRQLTRSPLQAQPGNTTWQLFGKQSLCKMSWWIQITPKRFSYFKNCPQIAWNSTKNISQPNAVLNASGQLCMPRKSCFFTWQLQPKTWWYPLSYYRPAILGEDDNTCEHRASSRAKRMSMGALTHCWRSQKGLICPAQLFQNPCFS